MGLIPYANEVYLDWSEEKNTHVRETHHPDHRPERLRRVERVLTPYAGDYRRMVEKPDLRITDEAFSRVLRSYAPRPRRTGYGVMGFYEVEEFLEVVRELLAQHRAVDYVLHRVADLRAFYGFRQPVHELVVDGLVEMG